MALSSQFIGISCKGLTIYCPSVLIRVYNLGLRDCDPHVFAWVYQDWKLGILSCEILGLCKCWVYLYTWILHSMNQSVCQDRCHTTIEIFIVDFMPPRVLLFEVPCWAILVVATVFIPSCLFLYYILPN